MTESDDSRDRPTEDLTSGSADQSPAEPGGGSAVGDAKSRQSAGAADQNGPAETSDAEDDHNIPVWQLRAVLLVLIGIILAGAGGGYWVYVRPMRLEAADARRQALEFRAEAEKLQAPTRAERTWDDAVFWFNHAESSRNWLNYPEAINRYRRAGNRFSDAAHYAEKALAATTATAPTETQDGNGQ